MDSADPSWKEWIQDLVAGKDQTVTEFWQLYGSRLQAVASKNLALNLRRRAEPDDIVQSVCRTFFRRAKDGQFQFDDSEQLWRLLYAITLTKTRQYARFHSRKKRGVNQERNINQQAEDGKPAFDFVADDPTPEETVQLSDMLEQLFSMLDEEQQQIVEMKLEQFTNDEIAGKMGCSERTVRRISKRIRAQLQKILSDSFKEP